MKFEEDNWSYVDEDGDYQDVKKLKRKILEDIDKKAEKQTMPESSEYVAGLNYVKEIIKKRFGF